MGEEERAVEPADGGYGDVSVEARLVHKNWKVREQAYVELRKLIENCTEEDGKDLLLSRFSPHLPDIVRDSNAAAQLAAMDASIGFVKAAPPALSDEITLRLAQSVVESAFNVRKINQERAQMLCTELMETGARGSAVEAFCLYGILHKVPKISSTSIRLVRDGLSRHGPDEMPLQLMAKTCSQVQSSASGEIRSEGKALTMELQTYLQDKELSSISSFPTSDMMDGIKGPEALCGTSVTPSCARKGMSTQSAGHDDISQRSVSKTKREGANSLAGLLVEVSGSEAAWVEALESASWSTRKRALERLDQALQSSHLRLDSLAEPPMFSHLADILEKDINLSVVRAASQALRSLAKILGRNFNEGIAVGLSKSLLSRLREQHRVTGEQLLATLQSLVDNECLSLDSCLNAIRINLSSRIVLVRYRTLSWLEVHARHPSSRERFGGCLSEICELLVCAVDDASQDVRRAAIRTLVALDSAFGASTTKSALAGLDGRMARVVEELRLDYNNNEKDETSGREFEQVQNPLLDHRLAHSKREDPGTENCGHKDMSRSLRQPAGQANTPSAARGTEINGTNNDERSFPARQNPTIDHRVARSKREDSGKENCEYKDKSRSLRQPAGQANTPSAARGTEINGTNNDERPFPARQNPTLDHRLARSEREDSGTESCGYKDKTRSLRQPAGQANTPSAARGREINGTNDDERSFLASVPASDMEKELFGAIQQLRSSNWRNRVRAIGVIRSDSRFRNSSHLSRDCSTAVVTTLIDRVGDTNKNIVCQALHTLEDFLISNEDLFVAHMPQALRPVLLAMADVHKPVKQSAKECLRRLSENFGTSRITKALESSPSSNNDFVRETFLFWIMDMLAGDADISGSDILDLVRFTSKCLGSESQQLRLAAEELLRKLEDRQTPVVSKSTNSCSSDLCKSQDLARSGVRGPSDQVNERLSPSDNGHVVQEYATPEKHMLLSTSMSERREGMDGRTTTALLVDTPKRMLRILDPGSDEAFVGDTPRLKTHEKENVSDHVDSCLWSLVQISEALNQSQFSIRASGAKLAARLIKEESFTPDAKSALGRVIRLLVISFRKVVDAAAGTGCRERARELKHHLQALLLLFGKDDLSSTIDVRTLFLISSEVLRAMPVERVDKMHNGGEKIQKGLSVLMRRILEKSNQTRMFHVLLNWLNNFVTNLECGTIPSQSISSSMRTCVKCLIKLTQRNFEGVHKPSLLRDAHVFLALHDRSSSNSPSADALLPLQCVRAILNELIKLEGERVYGLLHQVPTETKPPILAEISTLLRKQGLREGCGRKDGERTVVQESAKSSLPPARSPRPSPEKSAEVLNSRLSVILKKINSLGSVDEGLENLCEFAVENQRRGLTSSLKQMSPSARDLLSAKIAELGDGNICSPCTDTRPTRQTTHS
uniref:TOG domain-containing protein n=1 Tax=Rhodosorus marinus TaxID=101924 RepID=A0A7S3A0H5_9RHOD|mmetsp:Transcript_38722/g.152891  ORF Transcript_38722/g.152891 Transcript_38722/m.152891 type:complete len:1413 (+) Transcript_38722:74-4312(+)